MPPVPTEHQCCGTPAKFNRCDRKATVTRDGRRYCWEHDPVREAAKRAKRAAALKAEAEAHRVRTEAKWARSDLERDAGLRDLTDDDLRLIIAAGGMRAVLETLRRA